MKAFEVTALTNFIWACETFLFSGMLIGKLNSWRSAQGFWVLTLFFMGIGALLGGINHGFVEPYGDTLVRKVLSRLTALSVGVMTFFVLLTMRHQFAPPSWQRTILIIALVQLAVYTVIIILIDNFLVVVLNYAPVMILFLILSFAGLSSQSGSGIMIIGLLLSFVASAALALGVDWFSPLEREGLYHVILMVSVFFLYRGGLLLKSV